MKRKRLLLATLLILAAVSCGYIEVNSYMLGFYDIVSMGAVGRQVNIGGEEYIQLRVHVKKARMVTDVFGDRQSENGSYEELCRKYGDVSFRRRTLSLSANIGEPLQYCWPNADFRSIEVISGHEWDSSHPAGSSLDDLVWFVSQSVYPFIQSSYTAFDYHAYEWSEFFRSCYGGNHRMYAYPVDGPLSEIEPHDMMLLGPGSSLTQPGGLGYEEPDMLYFPPDVDSDDDPWLMSYNTFALFIPVSDSGASDLTVIITDENGENYTVVPEMI